MRKALTILLFASLMATTVAAESSDAGMGEQAVNSISSFANDMGQTALEIGSNAQESVERFLNTEEIKKAMSEMEQDIADFVNNLV